MEFYDDKEPWRLPRDKYPTWDDCMRYCKSRISKDISHKSVVNKLAEEVEAIWKSGDGCPKAKANIIVQFENSILPMYQKYRKGDALPNKSKKKKIQTPAQSPARRS